MEPVALLASAHSQLLRLISKHSGRHHAGLHQAAHAVRDRLSGATRKKLMRLEYAYHYSRHVTAPGIKQFVSVVSEELGGRHTQNAENIDRNEYQSAVDGLKAQLADMTEKYDMIVKSMTSITAALGSVSKALEKPLAGLSKEHAAILEHFDSVTASFKDPRFYDDFRDHLLACDLDPARLQPPADSCSVLSLSPRTSSSPAASRPSSRTTAPLTASGTTSSTAASRPPPSPAAPAPSPFALKFQRRADLLMKFSKNMLDPAEYAELEQLDDELMRSDPDLFGPDEMDDLEFQ